MGKPVPSRANESKGTGSGPVTEYRLTPEEIAERYGPPVQRKNRASANLPENKSNEEEEQQVPKPDILTKEFLESELAAGKSGAQVERELGMQMNTITYYIKKWGLKSQHQPLHMQNRQASSIAEPALAAPDQPDPNAAEVESLRREIENLKGKNVEVVDLAGKAILELQQKLAAATNLNNSEIERLRTELDGIRSIRDTEKQGHIETEKRMEATIETLEERLAEAVESLLLTEPERAAVTTGTSNVVPLPRTRRSMEVELAGEQEEIVDELSAILAYLKAAKGGKAFVLEMRLGELAAKEVGV